MHIPGCVLGPQAGHPDALRSPRGPTIWRQRPERCEPVSPDAEWRQLVHSDELEIGTATGYVAALLSERLGEELVFSVEIDPPLAHQARQNLATLGYAPTVVVADGEHGWVEAAPYDRLISTCALRRVPYELVRQVKPGGISSRLWPGSSGAAQSSSCRSRREASRQAHSGAVRPTCR
ncbi:methyltransferase domain-containing protein [Streptomyces spiramyceticus]|uniref:methyltransferase domain-containing protein n=1 Tax=Streptomyces spiramyceticus TaxID=299717 RepID=UPI00237BFE5D|nr:methyltransferase domain-containing protein [Streptomyces spiramyceticus]